MVQRQPCTQRGLILNRFDDTRERVAQEHRSRAHVEIDVLVPIDVPEVAGALAAAVDGGDSESMKLGPAAEKVGLAGDKFSRPAVEVQRSRYAVR